VRGVRAHRSAPFPSVETIATMPRRRLEKLIRPSGISAESRTPQRFARALLKDPSFLAAASACWRSMALAGDGGFHPCLKRYAAHQPVFVVDATPAGSGRRMGLFNTDEYAEVQAFFQSVYRGRRPV